MDKNGIIYSDIVFSGLSKSKTWKFLTFVKDTDVKVPVLKTNQKSLVFQTPDSWGGFVFCETILTKNLIITISKKAQIFLTHFTRPYGNFKTW